jgi:hypothetical protein
MYFRAPWMQICSQQKSAKCYELNILPKFFNMSCLYENDYCVHIVLTILKLNMAIQRKKRKILAIEFHAAESFWWN